jgi:penicillin-binding protein 1C
MLKWLFLSLLLFSAAGAGFYFWFLVDLPPANAVETRLVRPTTQILDRNGRLLYEMLDPQAGKQIDFDLTSLPAACAQAILATEDSRFYLHPGVDLFAILRAAWQNYRAGGQVVSGGSTLTQQLARNLLMHPAERYEQSLRRKVREAWLALQLELRYTKEELLALYLNQTYYGNFAFGLEAAAQIFFAKPTGHLSRAECALLAGLVQYPSGYNPLQNPQAAKLRQLTVLRLMREAGYITAEEVDAIAAEPLRYRSRLFNIQAPHFVMYIQDLLAQKLGYQRLRDGGLRVVTTLDLDLQRQTEASIRYRLDLLNCRVPGLCAETVASGKRPPNPNRRVDNAAAVILDSRTGDILAMVGSPDYFDATIQGNVNASLSLRQPGSAIKPLTYAAALDPGWNASLGLQPLTPASIIADLPTTFYVKDEKGGNTPYTPVNYDRLYHGPVSVRTALANSYNISAVKVLERMGVETLRQLAIQAGITSFTGDFGLALTLGGGEVKLLDLATAYGILDDGRRLENRAILALYDSRGSPLGAIYDWRSPVEQIVNRKSKIENQIISPATAYLITDILADPLARIPAFGEGSVLELPFAAAVKTGTTTDWRDNWTIGYSTQRIVGVWVGNADNTPMLDVSGIDGAGPIWRDLMLAAHDAPPPPFTRPDDIVEMAICAPSGLLPSPTCPRIRQERFIQGAEPTTPDNQFQTLVNPVIPSNPPAGPATPAERIAQRVYWMLPPEYTEWMISQEIPLAPPEHDREAERLGEWRVETPKDINLPISNLQSLILTSPISHMAYQLHPGAPRQRQRIEVAGYAADGRLWAELRLVKDGEVLAQEDNGTRLNAWWTLDVGEHRFWIEGVAQSGGDVVRSQPAFVLVEEYPIRTQN